MCEYKVVPSLQSVRQPPNLALNPRTNSNPRTVLGLVLQPLNVLELRVGVSTAGPCAYVCTVKNSLTNIKCFVYSAGVISSNAPVKYTTCISGAF